MTENQNKKNLKDLRLHLDEIERHILAIRSSMFQETIVDKRADLFVSPDNRIIEGIFTGDQMVDQEGKSYAVSPNYASKSQLVAGDKLKLTIAPDGSFVYKQIGPVERKRLVATLDKTSSQYFAVVGKKRYRVLLASVTYFKADAGDKVTIVTPLGDNVADWAAIENKIN
jgi:hypothetical protein